MGVHENNNISGVGVLESMSFYAPILITSSIILFSLFQAALSKGIFYLLLLFLISSLRYFSYSFFEKKNMFAITSTYSIFILAFTLCYLFIPMVIISSEYPGLSINYGVVLFFLIYITIDFSIKQREGFINEILGEPIMWDFLGGLGLGGLLSIIIYGSKIKNYLFINEMISGNQVCSKPTKQKFKCSVYKNGEIISSGV